VRLRNGKINAQITQFLRKIVFRKVNFSPITATNHQLDFGLFVAAEPEGIAAARQAGPCAAFRRVIVAA